MFDVGLYITVYADNENDLFKIENEILNVSYPLKLQSGEILKYNTHFLVLRKN
jgi:hypothetical protein